MTANTTIHESAPARNSARNTSELATLPLAWIEPWEAQPRKRFGQEALEELAGSIAEHGLIEPLVVRPIGPGSYRLIAGERRWRACQMIGLGEVPVQIRVDVDDAAAMKLALAQAPVISLANVVDGHVVDAERPGDFRPTHAFSAQSQNLLDVLWRELRLWVLVARKACDDPPALLLHVIHVVLRRAKKQVIRPDTCSVVARVADEQTGRNGAVCHLVGGAVGKQHRRPLSTCADTPVTGRVVSAGPEPAALGLPHVLPETLAHRLNPVLTFWHHAQMMVLHVTLSSGHRLAAAAGAGACRRFHVSIIALGLYNLQRNRRRLDISAPAEAAE